MQKSATTFSKNVQVELRESIKQALGLGATQSHDKYLGLPTLIGRGKKEAFRAVKERVWNKMQLWHGKMLSIGGHELLIKSIAESVPIYTMSVFRLPASLCEDLQALVA